MEVAQGRGKHRILSYLPCRFVVGTCFAVFLETQDERMRVMMTSQKLSRYRFRLFHSDLHNGSLEATVQYTGNMIHTQMSQCGAIKFVCNGVAPAVRWDFWVEPKAHGGAQEHELQNPSAVLRKVRRALDRTKGANAA